ncbi:hypothetical protein EJB05_02642, partial [Eragrostis curvula]
MGHIPGDMVVNAMMVAMAVHWNEKGRVVIHVTSSLQNPLSTSTTLDMMYRYFSSNPQIGKNGRVIKAKRFNDTNLARLQAATSKDKHEAHVFDCDPKSIDWEHYFYNIHIPGVLKYAQKK